MFGEPLDHARVREPDESLQDLQLLTQAERETGRETLVVDVLGLDAEDALKEAGGIEDRRQVHLAHAPRERLCANRAFERGRRGAVAATGIEPNEVDRAHRRADCRAPMTYG